MGEWLNLDSALKAITILGTTVGVLKSWRNQWKGPKGLFGWIEEQRHLRYTLYRRTQERDYLLGQLAERDRQLDQLTERIMSHTATASLLESSVASVVAVTERHPQHPPEDRDFTAKIEAANAQLQYSERVMRDAAERAENLRKIRHGNGNLYAGWLVPDSRRRPK